MINFRREKLFFLIFVLCILCGCVGSVIIKNTYSIRVDYGIDFISDNIVKLNSLLGGNVDTSNSYYIEEIVDENGNVPAHKYYGDSMIPSRAINDLKGYDNKIFLGLGDYDKNTGPVKIIYYDTLTGKIESSGTINDEEVQFFEIIDNKLYTTGADPRDTKGNGSYYTYDKNSNSWNQYLFNNGWIHVYNIKKFKDKMFMFGSVTDVSGRSPVQVSYDNGLTFENVKLIYSFNGSPREEVPGNSNMRCYGAGYYGDKFYIHIYFNDDTTGKLSIYSGLYEYDDEKKEFNYIAGLPSKSGGHNLSSANTYNYVYFRNITFNDKLLFISGNYLIEISANEDLNSKFKVKTSLLNVADTKDVYGVQDAVIAGDTLYLLYYRYNDNKTFDTRIYKTKDLKNFEKIYEFNLNSVPFAIEYYNNNLYIGTGYDKNYIDINETGSLYKLDLDVFKKYLILDEKNKVINVKSDGISYPVNYDISSDKNVFKTTLSFDKNMSEKEWNYEYSKLGHLNWIYSLVDNSYNMDFDLSSSYFNNVLYKNVKKDISGYSNGLELAKDIFDNKLKIIDEKFIISSENIIATDDKYIISIELVVNNNDSSNNNSDNNDSSNDNSDNNDSSNDNSDNNDSSNNNSDNKDNNNSGSDNIINVIITSSIYKINNKLKYIYVGTDKNFDIIKNNVNVSGLSDAKISLDNNKFIVSRNNKELSVFNILSIKFNHLNITNKEIFISERISYNDFIKNIILADGLSVKVFNNDNEVTSGDIEGNMIVRIYYANEIVDEYIIIDNIGYYLRFDDNLEIDEVNKLFTNVMIGTDIESVNKMIDTNGIISVYDKSNNLVSDYSCIVGTGYRFNIKLSNVTFDYTASVKGDINGDGVINNSDLFSITRYLIDKSAYSGNEYLVASDINNDNNINVNDVVKIYKYLIIDSDL